MVMAKAPLEGIRVVDITGYVTGPLTTQALADLGAEVVKIETRGRMGAGGEQAGLGGGMQRNGGKLSVTLNFTTPEGADLLRRLVAVSDIVIENLSGGTLARRGLGYDDLRKVKPDLIMLSSCMQGQTGPYSEHAASGHKLTALAGFNQIAGWPDRPPGWIGAYTDFIAPHYNIIAVLAALDYRRQTGKGQYLDVSQYESSVQFIAPIVLDYQANGRVAGRMGNQVAYAVPHNAYRCLGEDRWCAITVFTDDQWRAFCGVVGDPAWTKDTRFSTLLARKENEADLDRLINEWTSPRTAEAVMAAMQSAGVPAGIVENPEDQLDRDPQLRERRFFRQLDYPNVGPYRAPLGTHFLLSKDDIEAKRAPVLGEHNEYVFKQLLGLPDAEYTRLVSAAVIH